MVLQRHYIVEEGTECHMSEYVVWDCKPGTPSYLPEIVLGYGVDLELGFPALVERQNHFTKFVKTQRPEPYSRPMGSEPTAI